MCAAISVYKYVPADLFLCTIVLFIDTPQDKLDSPKVGELITNYISVFKSVSL